MPERTACYVCGRTWSDYVEKLTEERRHREDKTARRICKGCFQSAKRKAQKAAVFLPGTFDVTRAERLTTGIGRCTVCNLDRAAYLDRAAGTALCEYCYHRAMQAQGRGEVVG